MIHLRLSPFQKTTKDKEIEIIIEETVSQAAERVLEGIPRPENKSFSDVFVVLVDGMSIKSEDWDKTVLQKHSDVLFIPRLKGDEGGIFKQFITMAVVLAVSVYATPQVGAVAGGLLSAAAGIGTSLLLNALIPPPVASTAAATENIEESQMYSITNQANAINKFGNVPKVYGEHRMFPVLVANPYTQIVVDPTNQELSQYLYAIYDFGLGPVSIRDIKIGDTPIQEFQEAFWRIVDPNRPDQSEGPWDDVTMKDFGYYRGKANTESLGVNLNGNKNTGSALIDYQVIRNAAPNPLGQKQRITLNFVNVQGLYAYSAAGELVERAISLDIQFAKVGTEDWRSFKDYAYVEEYTTAGGNLASDTVMVGFPGTQNPVLSNTGNPNSVINYPYGWVELSISERAQRSNPTRWGTYVTYGYPVGTSSFQFRSLNGAIKVNDILYYNDSRMGKVVTAVYTGSNNIYNITIDTPLQNAIVVNTLFRCNQSLGGGTGLEFPNGTNSGTAQYPYRMSRASGALEIRRKSTTPAYSSFEFVPKEIGEYKIKVVRNSSTSIYTAQIVDSLTFSSITTRFDSPSIITDKRHTFLEVRIKATNQLNGSISNLSAIATSVLDVYDPNTETWSKQPTRNPAWVYVDLLTGQVNKRAISKDRLDLPSILEWAEFCEEVPVPPPDQEYQFPRFRCDFILDYRATLTEVINQVCSAAQAGLNVTNGKYGVLVDRFRSTPVQIFTNRNSSDFSSTRRYPKKPDALKVKYVDSANEWKVSELYVYDDWFNFENTKETEDISSFAVTNNEQAWRFGRYILAQNRLRQETISIKVDFENLICTRGDYVMYVQDVMRVGGVPCRAKSVVGNSVTTDDRIPDLGAVTYGCTFRKRNGQILTTTVTRIDDYTMELDGVNFPQKGDLLVIGEMGKVTIDCIVKSITPDVDLSATLVLVEKADAIYSAESTSTLPVYDPQISESSDPDYDPRPVEDLLIADNAYECAGGAYRYFINVDWEPPRTSSYEYFEVYVNNGNGFTLATTTRNSFYAHTVDQAYLDVEHNFKVLVVSKTGRKLDLASVETVSATPLAKTNRPSTVQNFSSDAIGDRFQLSWDLILDCDVREYAIRYSPNVNDHWDSSVPLTKVSSTSTTVFTQNRLGIYLIKAVDFGGRESTDPAIIVPTIPIVPNLTEILTIDLINGDGISVLPPVHYLERVEMDVSGRAVLQVDPDSQADDKEYFSDGYLYAKGQPFISGYDFQGIFTAKLTASIEAYGFGSDLYMVDWPVLSELGPLTSPQGSEWDVELQYRSIGETTYMSEWGTLNTVIPLSQPGDDHWSPWRKFVSGEITCRKIQYRLKIISLKKDVTPVVKKAVLKIEMEKRVEVYSGTSSDSLPVFVPFEPAFYNYPQILIDIVGAAPGDSVDWLETTWEPNGINVVLADSMGNQISRDFNLTASGYGRKSTQSL